MHAIKHMQPPSTATEARSFLGLENTIARFLPNLAAMTEPIRRITHRDCPWSWGPEQSETLNNLPDLISSDTVLAHVDPSLPIPVSRDACKIESVAPWLRNTLMVLSGLLRMQAAVYHPSNSPTAKPKKKPYQEHGHVRSFIFISTAASST